MAIAVITQHAVNPRPSKFLLLAFLAVVLAMAVLWHEPLSGVDDTGTDMPVVNAIGTTKEEAEEAAEELIDESLRKNPNKGLWPANGRPGAKPVPKE